MDDRNLQVQVVRGPHAERLLADADFLQQWASLKQSCPWSTAYQSSGFVCTWYEVYREQYEPLLALARGADAAIAGLMPLAVSRKDGGLLVAGTVHCEYSGWICTPDLADTFAPEAMRALRRLVPGGGLQFRYLPPGTPTDWITHGEFRGICHSTSHCRPVLRFGDGSEIEESLRKSGNKGRIRKLKKIGAVEFVHVDNVAALEPHLDSIIRCYDARSMAAYGLSPFADDPLKRQFHLALMKVPGLMHVTLLKAGEHVVGAQMNIRDGRQVRLSLIAHDPMQPKASPGKLHILMLAKMLRHEGYEELDLTPGDDAYKQRFATHGESVDRLNVFADPSRRRASAAMTTVKMAARSALSAVRISPNRATAVIERVRSLRSASVQRAVATLKRRWLGSPDELWVYRLQGSKPLSDQADRFHHDRLEDLAFYDPRTWGVSRRRFLSTAFDRIEEEQRVYTFAESGRLVSFGWLAERPSEELIDRLMPGVVLPHRSAVVHELFTAGKARRRGLAQRCLRSMLTDAAATQEKQFVFATVPASRPAARALLVKAGFEPAEQVLRQVEPAPQPPKKIGSAPTTPSARAAKFSLGGLHGSFAGLARGTVTAAFAPLEKGSH